MTSLTTLDGIGSNLAETLNDAGIDSVETLSDSTTEILTDIDGIGEQRASSLITTAVTSRVDDATTSESDVDVVTPDGMDESTETDAGDTDIRMIDVSVEMDATVSPHVLNACLSEIRRLLRRNNVSQLEDMAIVTESVLSCPDFLVFDPTSEKRVTLEVSLIPERVTALYRSVNSQATDYRRDGSLSSVGGKLQQVANEINEHRPVNNDSE
jgi:predicted RecB family nuclease